jgi:hypothetical protein
MIKLGQVIKHFNGNAKPDICQVTSIYSNEKVRIKSLYTGKQKTVDICEVVRVL